MEHVDAIVAGAGPAGSVTALLLAASGLRVALVHDPGLDVDRTEVIHPTTTPILGELGLGCLLDDPRVARICLGIRRTDVHGTSQIDEFIRHPGGRGHAVSRRHFDAALRTVAEGAGARLVAGRLSHVVAGPGRVECRLGTTGQTICAAHVVDATGRRASVARRLGGRLVVAERLVAERRTGHRRAVDGLRPTWLDVRDDGIAWSYGIVGPDGLSDHWMVRPGGVGASAREVRVDNASATFLSPAAEERWTAVGDAAAAFDPSTGQGLANALATARAAARRFVRIADGRGPAADSYARAVVATFLRTEGLRTPRARGNGGIPRRSERPPTPPLPRDAHP